MWKLQSKTNNIIVENSLDKIQLEKSIKSKSMMPRVMVLVHCTAPQWDLSAYEISSQFSVSYAPDKIQEWKWTKDNNSKSMKLWVMVLVQCTSPQWDLLPMKFYVDALYRFKVIFQTKKGTDGPTDWRMDGRTDESITICHPLGA